MGLCITRPAKSRKSIVFLPLLIAALLLASAVVINAVPVYEFPVRGTFRYTIFIVPEWLNTSLIIQGSTYGRGIILWYGWSYEIVEPQLAAANAPLLQVTSASLAYNMSTTQAFSRGAGLNFDPPYNRIWGYYTVSGNSSASGDSVWNGTSLFEDSFLGPELPYLTHLVYPWQGAGYYVNINDLISQTNLTKGNIEIQWWIWLNDIQATVNPDSMTLRPAYIRAGDTELFDINITVRQGNPDEILYANSSTSTIQSSDLPQTNLTLDSPIDLYNPNLQFLKGIAGYLAGASLLLIVAEAVLLHSEKPKAP